MAFKLSSVKWSYLSKFIQQILCWLCLVLLQSTGLKWFWADPNILGLLKNLNFVPTQKLNILDGNHLLVGHKKSWTCTISKWIFGVAKKKGTTQNIVEGQGNNLFCKKYKSFTLFLDAIYQVSTSKILSDQIEFTRFLTRTHLQV